MKGYYTNGVYFGYIPSTGKYMQFETESAYVEFLRETEEQNGNL
jgi:hypothetical protein